MAKKKFEYKLLALPITIFFPILYEYLYPLLPPYPMFKIGYNIFFTLPIIIVLFGLFIALRIKHYRVFWDTLFFLVVYLSIIGFQYLPFKTLQLSQIAQSLSVFIPISIILISLYPPAAEYSFKEFVYQFTVFGGSLLLIFTLPINHKEFFDILFSSHIFINQVGWQLPDYIWFLLILMIPVLYFRANSANRPLIIILILSVFLLFQCLNLAALVNASTHKVRFYTAFLFVVIGIFAIYYMFYLRRRRELYDSLTDLGNEKYLRKIIKKYRGNLTLAVIEIDNSEQFAQKYGKEEYANLLRFIARQLAKESDAEAFRLEGGNFALLYLAEDDTDILWQLNSIREKISHKKFIIRKSEKERRRTNRMDRGKMKDWPDDVFITLSFGAASRKNKRNEYDLLKEEAFKALDAAKSKGGNRCIRYEELFF
jgi:GGDEF domain-containing protein